MLGESCRGSYEDLASGRKARTKAYTESRLHRALGELTAMQKVEAIGAKVAGFVNPNGAPGAHFGRGVALPAHASRVLRPLVLFFFFLFSFSVCSRSKRESHLVETR